MTSEQIKLLIREELKSLKDLSDVYGLNLNICLIEPTKQTYISSVDESVTFELWTVMEEVEDRTGYKITFDPHDRLLDLGILTDKDELMDIGTYGTFLETLRAM